MRPSIRKTSLKLLESGSSMSMMFVIWWKRWDRVASGPSAEPEAAGLKTHVLVSVQVPQEFNFTKSTAGQDGLVKDFDELFARDFLASLEVSKCAVIRRE
jgi:hypothetical protein